MSKWLRQAVVGDLSAEGLATILRLIPNWEKLEDKSHWEAAGDPAAYISRNVSIEYQDWWAGLLPNGKDKVHLVITTSFSVVEGGKVRMGLRGMDGKIIEEYYKHGERVRIQPAYFGTARVNIGTASQSLEEMSGADMVGPIHKLLRQYNFPRDYRGGEHHTLIYDAQNDTWAEE